MQKMPPGPNGLPFFGNILAYDRDRLGFIQHMYTKYGEISSFEILQQRLVLLTEPEHIKYLLTNHPQDFPSNKVNQALAPLFGQGLLSNDGDYHLQQRRLVQPAFHKKRVDRYTQVMINYIHQLLNSWQPGQRINIATEMRKLTLRVVGKVLLNVDFEEEALSAIGQAFVATHRFIYKPWLSPASIRLNMPFLPYGQFMRKLKLLDDTIYAVIARQRSHKEGTHNDNAVSILLETQEQDNSQMTDKQLHDQLMTLLGAGLESTTNLLSWTFYLLSLYPDVHQRLVSEIQDGLQGELPNGENIHRIPYLDQVIDEVLRLYPPEWMIARHALKDCDFSGYHFPAGTLFVTSPWITHRSHRYFPDADVFQPERFSPENRQKIPNMAYFPFSAGPHMCIGKPFAQLEAKLLLATILSCHSFEFIPGFTIESQTYNLSLAKFFIKWSS